jgi:hypothetical protein
MSLEKCPIVMGHQVFVYECSKCHKKIVTFMGKRSKCNCKKLKTKRYDQQNFKQTKPQGIARKD